MLKNGFMILNIHIKLSQETYCQICFMLSVTTKKNELIIYIFYIKGLLYVEYVL